MIDCECVNWGREAASEATEHHPRCPRFDGARRVVEHLEYLSRVHGYMDLQIGFAEAVILIAQVQLALRHPGNIGDTAQQARAILDAWIETLDRSSPGIGALLRLGFDRSCDVPEAERVDENNTGG